MPAPPDITQLLQALRDGDRASLDTLYRVLYDELHRLAHAQRRRWHGDHTVNTTALVHEAYLKLARQDAVVVGDRSHFFTLAAQAMRQILSNYARDRRAQKRGGEAERVTLQSTVEEAGLVPDEQLHTVITIDEALKQLEALEPRQARVVECRFFIGFSVADTAAALNISNATVKRDWALASAWLRRVLAEA